MRTPLILAASSLVLVALAGCSIAVTEPDAADPSHAASEQPGTSDQPDQPDPDVSAEADPADELPPEDSGETSWSEDIGAEREEALDSVTAQVTCDGELVIGATQAGQVIEVDGPCDRLVVDADAGIVIAGVVGVLDLAGSGAVVYADGLSELNVTGSASWVHWLGPTPAVDDSGAGNVLTAG